MYYNLNLWSVLHILYIWREKIVIKIDVYSISILLLHIQWHVTITFRNMYYFILSFKYDLYIPWRILCTYINIAKW